VPELRIYERLFVALRTLPKIIALLILVGACAPQRSLGSAMLNLQPAPPTFAGQYDFDLLDQVRGKACVNRAKLQTGQVSYWFGGFAFPNPPSDSLTRAAIAAATADAIDRISRADSIVITRVVTEGQTAEEVCAYVYGRAIRLKKATPVSSETPAETTPSHDDSTPSSE
jgi:hypothetical protein